MIDHLPWLVGSIGTLVFDFTIFFQFLCFGESKADSFDLDKEPGASGASPRCAPVLSATPTSVVPVLTRLLPTGLRETDPLLQAV